MIPLSISNATEVYRDAYRCEIVRHWVIYPPLAKFSRLLSTFVQSLGCEAEDEFWRRSLAPIRRLGFAFCSAPLPFSKATIAIGLDWKKLHRQVHLCEQLFPDAYEKFVALTSQLENLSIETTSPFLEHLKQLHQGRSNGLCVVLRNPRMNQTVAEYFSQTATLRNTKVVSPSQLRGRHFCNTLAVIGPCNWFPDHVFVAPRAPAIHVISPRWIRDSWKPNPVFLNNSSTSGGENRNHRIGAMPAVIDDTSPENHSPTELLPEDLLPPKPDFGSNAQLVTYQLNGNEETVPAYLCYLCGHQAVFVATDDDTKKLLIININEMGREVVKSVPASKLEPGHYLLLRTSGDNDFIASFADRIMGEIAEKRRAEQAEWKQKLFSAAVARFGQLSRRELADCINTELQSQTFSHTRSANIHYWMSPKCIRPRKIEDFTTILAFAGIKERSQELWKAMGDIGRAHIRAGHAIRRMLIHKIETSSLELLERDGEMVFELGDESGGSLSAFLITEISSENYEVSADQIGVLLEMED